MEKRKNFTVSVYTEYNVGLLHRISAIFLKRHINIESFTTSESEIKNVYRFIIVVKMTKSGIERVIKLIEKQVEVIKAFYHRDDETIFGFENGDLSKRVDLRITGVISDLVPVTDVNFVYEGENIEATNPLYRCGDTNYPNYVTI